MTNLSAEPLPFRGQTFVEVPAGRSPVGVATLNDRPCLMLADALGAPARLLRAVVQLDGTGYCEAYTVESYIGSLRHRDKLLHVYGVPA